MPTSMRDLIIQLGVTLLLTISAPSDVDGANKILRRKNVSLYKGDIGGQQNETVNRLKPLRQDVIPACPSNDKTIQAGYTKHDVYTIGEPLKIYCLVRQSHKSMKVSIGTIKHGDVEITAPINNVPSKYGKLSSFIRPQKNPPNCKERKLKGNRKCFTECVYEYEVIVSAYLTQSWLHCCTDDKTCVNKQMVLNITYGYTAPILVHSTSNGLEVQDLDLTFGDRNIEIATCIARLGKDNTATGTVGIWSSAPSTHSDLIYDSNAKRLEWYATYNTRNAKIKEVGDQPDSLKVKVNSSESVFLGGHFIMMTLSVKRVTTELYHTTMFCRSNIDTTRPDYVKRYPETVKSNPINIVYLPSQPILTVDWLGKPGIIYAGHFIQAHCSASVGSDKPPLGIKWHMKTSTMHYNWTLNYPEATVDTPLPGWVEITNTPAHRKCPQPNSFSWFQTGVCYFHVDRLLTWESALDYNCQEMDGDSTIVNNIEDRTVFDFLRVEVGTRSYWIGLEYSATDRRYKWKDGTKTDVSKWGTWVGNNRTVKSNPRLHHCVVLTGEGLKRANCSESHQIMCQTRPAYVISPLTFDRNSGHSLKSSITISVKAFHDGSHIQCSVWTGDKEQQAGVAERKVNLVSEKSLEFQFVYGQLVPKLTHNESNVDTKVHIFYNCTAYVGKEGLMTMTLKHKNGTLRTWLVGKEDNDVYELNWSPYVNVTLINERRSTNIGRRLQATMGIELTWDFHQSHVTCYPYDITDENVKIVSYRDKSELLTSHIIDMKKIYDIPATRGGSTTGLKSPQSTRWKHLTHVKHRRLFSRLKVKAIDKKASRHQFRPKTLKNVHPKPIGASEAPTTPTTPASKADPDSGEKPPTGKTHKATATPPVSGGDAGGNGTDVGAKGNTTAGPGKKKEHKKSPNDAISGRKSKQTLKDRVIATAMKYLPSIIGFALVSSIFIVACKPKKKADEIKKDAADTGGEADSVAPAKTPSAAEAKPVEDPPTDATAAGAEDEGDEDSGDEDDSESSDGDGDDDDEDDEDDEDDG